MHNKLVNIIMVQNDEIILDQREDFFLLPSPPSIKNSDKYKRYNNKMDLNALLNIPPIQKQNEPIVTTKKLPPTLNTSQQRFKVYPPKVLQRPDQSQLKTNNETKDSSSSNPPLGRIDVEFKTLKVEQNIHKEASQSQYQALLAQPQPPPNGTIIRNPRYINGKMIRPVLNVERESKEKIRLNDERKGLQRIFESQFTQYDIIENKDDILKAHQNEVMSNVFSWPTDQIRELFCQHFIEFLSKKSPKFPKARYHCCICKYHLDTIYATLNHLSQIRHTTLEYSTQFEYTVNNIPNISTQHAKYLTELIIDIMEKRGLDENDLIERKGVVDRLNKIATNEKHKIRFAMFGSSCYNLGMKTSNLNITLDFYGEEGEGVIVYNFLKSIPFVRELRANLKEKLPTIEFIDSLTGITCLVQIENIGAMKLSLLLSSYFLIEPKLKPVAFAFRRFAEVCDIDKAVLGSLPSFAYIIMTIHFFQQIGLLPIIDVDSAENDFHKLSIAKPDSVENMTSNWGGNGNRKKSQVLTIGDIWIELLKYYSTVFNYRDFVISIMTITLVRSDKIWNRKISIEDPIYRKKNISKTVHSSKMCDHIVEKISIAYHYFGIPRTSEGHLYDGIIGEMDAKFHKSSIFHKKFKKQEDFVQGSNSNEVELILPMVKVKDISGNDTNMIIFQNVEQLTNHLSYSDYFYEFTFEALEYEKPLIIICKSCASDEHMLINCPDEFLDIQPINIPSLLTLKILGTLIAHTYDSDKLSTSDMMERGSVYNDIIRVFKTKFPTVELSLFGSTLNGFGIRNSDLDICLSVQNRVLDKKLIFEYPDFLKSYMATLVNCLKRSEIMSYLQGIPTAKVPIIKFKHNKSSIEGDISLSNILSLHNTRLLRCYAFIDDRLKILAVFLKRITRICDINDASKGSLSSYAYTLMLIHFLQRRPVPILPVLQELGEPGEILVNEWNTWYYDDLENLENVWPHFRKNRESLGELWLGFIIYYTEEFNFEENVISISQLAPLSRADKKWYSDGIAIEDPFDKTHNISLGLSKKMSTHIRKAFIHLRDFFFTSIDDIKVNNWKAYYFSSDNLSIGIPPLDRQCRICRKIGHFAKNCENFNESRKISDKDLSIEHETLPTPPLKEESVFPKGFNESYLRSVLPTLEIITIPAYFCEEGFFRRPRKELELFLNDINSINRPILRQAIDSLLEKYEKEDKKSFDSKNSTSNIFSDLETDDNFKMNSPDYLNNNNNNNNDKEKSPETDNNLNPVMNCNVNQNPNPSQPLVYQNHHLNHQQAYVPPGFNLSLLPPGVPIQPHNHFFNPPHQPRFFMPPHGFPIPHPQFPQMIPVDSNGYPLPPYIVSGYQARPAVGVGMMMDNRSGMIYSSAENFRGVTQCTPSPLKTPLSALSDLSECSTSGNSSSGSTVNDENVNINIRSQQQNQNQPQSQSPMFLHSNSQQQQPNPQPINMDPVPPHLLFQNSPFFGPSKLQPPLKDNNI